jgi:Cu/Ag efflux protein CusF
MAMELTLPGEPEVDQKSDAACDVAAPADLPLARGRVVAVDRPAGRITLEFQPMPPLLPEGGKRIFRVEDAASLKGLGPGDKVRFEVERDGRNYTVTRIENSN